MGKILRALLALFLATAVVGHSLAAEECRATSAMKKAALVELFTSDGCDSCPPANKWVSEAVQREAAKRGDRTLIPLSMHVTYWNYLGWKDRFSRGFFDGRQDAYAGTATHKFSYTPELFLNGREWSEWRGDGGAIAAAQGQPAPLSIDLSVKPQGSGLAVDAAVTAKPGEKVDLSAARLYLVLYEDNLTEHPNAGELKGAALRHDHVVRDWKILDVAQAGKAAQQFSVPPDADRKNLGVVAFVQSKDLKSVYQAVDLPLCF